MKPLIAYRKEHGLCYECGEKAETGKTRCLWCLQRIAGRQRMYEERKRSENPESYYRKKREYQKKWQEKNPEKMAVYRARKRDYNRKYFYGGEEW